MALLSAEQTRKNLLKVHATCTLPRACAYIIKPKLILHELEGGGGGKAGICYMLEGLSKGWSRGTQGCMYRYITELVLKHKRRLSNTDTEETGMS